MRYENKNLPLPKLTAHELDKKVAPILKAMGKTGILVDIPYLQKLEKKFSAALKKTEREIWKLAGRQFLISSPQQVAHVLFKELKLKAPDPDYQIKKTKTGLSTAAGELEKIRRKNPIVEKILRHRELSKLLTTYVVPLPKLVKKDGRLHTTFLQETASGRLSSQNPNLQNIPKRTEEGNEIRNAFIAPKDNALVSIDYSQIELRVGAWLAHDDNMLEAFQKGMDIHEHTARLLHCDRREAKAINFGLFYGKGAYSLAQELGVSRDEAQAWIDAYFVKYPALKALMDYLKEQLKEKHYVTTYLGRQREFPEMKGHNEIAKRAAERAALNHPMQGTAAEIMKLGMLAALKAVKRHPQVKLLLSVHDELVFEAPASLVQSFAKEAARAMTNVKTIPVPLDVEVKAGERWGSLHAIGNRA